MDKRFTQKLLIQYIYGEISGSAKLFIKEMLQEDPILKEQHDMLLAAGHQLPKFRLYPRKKTLQNILEYSQSQICV